MKTIAKRLHDGQDLLVEINKLVKENDIKAGVILSAVGSLRTSKIRVPVIRILDETVFTREPDSQTGFDELVVKRG